MSFEFILSALLLVSLLTGLVTQGIKTLLDEYNKTYYSNTLAAVVSIVLSVGVTVGYMVITETAWNYKIAVYLIALILLSWLCAMLGYDKIVQALSQWKNGKGEQ